MDGMGQNVSSSKKQCLLEFRKQIEAEWFSHDASMGRLYIYLYIYHKNQTIHIGKYTSPMDGMCFLRSHDICTSFSGHDPLDW